MKIQMKKMNNNKKIYKKKNKRVKIHTQIKMKRKKNLFN